MGDFHCELKVVYIHSWLRATQRMYLNWTPEHWSVRVYEWPLNIAVKWGLDFWLLTEFRKVLGFTVHYGDAFKGDFQHFRDCFHCDCFFLTLVPWIWQVTSRFWCTVTSANKHFPLWLSVCMSSEYFPCVWSAYPFHSKKEMLSTKWL